MMDNLPIASVINYTEDNNNIITIQPELNTDIVAEVATITEITNNYTPVHENIATAEIAYDYDINVPDIVVEISHQVATGDNINRYIAIRSVSDYLNILFIRKNQDSGLNNVIRQIERYNNVLSVNERSQLYCFIREREALLNKFSVFFLLNSAYVFINLFSILFFPNVIGNLYAFIYITPKTLQMNIITNLLAIVLILVTNTIVTLVLNNWLKFFLNSNMSLIVSVIYLTWLHMVSIIIIMIYCHIIGKLSKLRNIYQGFTQNQLSVLGFFFI
tara:strand:+ start:3388 stop:4209 length:822 start_codon:yes stop_codon:yes gene_type:complete